MHNVLRYTILTLVVTVACLASIFPVDENLRLGKDLAGGVSLVYTIDVDSTDASNVVDRTINVLRDRVNPQGLYEISFQQQGRDRVEITMPLPNEKVLNLRRAYEAALAKLNDYRIDADAFQRAMRLRGSERDAALDAMMDTEARRELLQPVKDSVRKAEETRAAYEAARAALPPSPEAGTMLEAAGEADAALEQARDAVLASSVSPDEVRAALEFPDRAHKISDSKGEVAIDSPRAQAIEGVRNRLGKLTNGAAQLDAIISSHKDYSAKRRGFDDPGELIRLLQGAGVLEFRIAVEPGSRTDEQRIRQELRERGPDNVKVDGAGWFRINAIDNWYNNTADLTLLRDNPATFFGRRGLVGEARDGLYYILLHDAPGLRMTKAEGDWALAGANPTQDQLGRPAIGFQMDPRGALLLGDLTERNVGKPMAIVLDDQVYTAPNLNSRIANSGIIEGNFPPSEIAYLVKTLSAGSLQAKLGEQPISQSVLAPELGADNLEKALRAAWIAFIAIGVFMVVYYFFSGGVAMVALLVNAIIVVGIMALNKAAFTLPGIAGVILIFGTAVDANVLIYERIREELRNGHDIRTALRIAFKRAGTTIIDANMTHLIVALVLSGALPFFDPPQEIKGFGITLGIGVFANLFCTMVVTRLIYTLLVDRMNAGPWVVNQLPVAIPAIQRFLTPRIDWMRLFPFFSIVSVFLIGLGLFFVFREGSNLLDSEFRGGTSITLQLKESPTSSDPENRLVLTRAQVEERVQTIAAKAATGGPLVELRGAEVVPIDPRGDGVTSDRFTIRTTVLDEQALRDAFAASFGDVVESRAPITFERASEVAIESAPVYGIVDGRLGANFDRPEITNDVNAYLGGAAILLEDLEPPPSKAALLSRLSHVRNSPTFSGDALKRDMSLVVIDGTDDAVRTAVVLIHDPRLSVFEDETKWRAGLAAQEWSIAREALTQTTFLANFNTFQPAIAQTFRAQAIIAITLCFVLISIYVWVRFGSVRYSFAAVRPLIFDTLVSIGMVALAEVIYDHVPGAAQAGIRPIKIDLGVVAAIMTIIGYSINDTVVILDRIRENRGKLAYASKKVINDSINQTISRTVVTAGTVLVSLVVLFYVGGEGVASFAYVMICGMVAGTYSTIAISAPMVYDKRVPPLPPETPDLVQGPGDERLLPA